MAVVRQTKQRTAVVEVLRATKTHPDAAWIHDKVRERVPNVSLGTVYRILEALVQEGSVMTIEHAGQATRYDYNAGEHHHAVCRECAAVFDVPLQVQLTDDATEGLPAGFVVIQTHVEFVGICASCYQRDKQDESAKPN